MNQVLRERIGATVCFNMFQRCLPAIWCIQTCHRQSVSISNDRRHGGFFDISKCRSKTWYAHKHTLLSYSTIQGCDEQANIVASALSMLVMSLYPWSYLTRRWLLMCRYLHALANHFYYLYWVIWQFKRIKTVPLQQISASFTNRWSRAEWYTLLLEEANFHSRHVEWRHPFFQMLPEKTNCHSVARACTVVNTTMGPCIWNDHWIHPLQQCVGSVLWVEPWKSMEIFNSTSCCFAGG